ncbi:MAG: hypothetical protein ABL962_08030 [Fimbriimonadaceae bacterium]
MFVALASVDAQAADYELICENPGREYLVTYDVGDSGVVINPDSDAIRQPILAIIDNDSLRVLVLDLGQAGMASLLHLRPYLKNEIFAEGELLQTDACYNAS